MPNQNQTGPEGQGALTGRGMGGCRQKNQGPAETDPSAPFTQGSGQDQGPGRGAGRGLGGGGRCRGGRGGRGEGGQGRR